MKKIVLLGAGASVGAGIPTAVEMTERIARLIFDSNAQIRRQVNTESDNTSRTISIIAGGLQFQQAMQGGDPFRQRGVNIEQVFNKGDTAVRCHR